MNENVLDVLMQCGVITQKTKLDKVYKLHSVAETIAEDCIEIIHRYKLESEQTGTYPHKVLDDIMLALRKRYCS